MSLFGATRKDSRHALFANEKKQTSFSAINTVAIEPDKQLGVYAPDAVGLFPCCRVLTTNFEFAILRGPGTDPRSMLFTTTLNRAGADRDHKIFIQIRRQSIDVLSGGIVDTSGGGGTNATAGGGAGGAPRMFSSSHTPRTTGEVSTPLAVTVSTLACPSSPPRRRSRSSWRPAGRRPS